MTKVDSNNIHLTMSAVEGKLELVSALKSFETTLVQCVSMLKRKPELPQKASSVKTRSDPGLANSSSDGGKTAVTREDKVNGKNQSA